MARGAGGQAQRTRPDYEAGVTPTQVLRNVQLNP